MKGYKVQSIKIELLLLNKSICDMKNELKESINSDIDTFEVSEEISYLKSLIVKNQSRILSILETV